MRGFVFALVLLGFGGSPSSPACGRLGAVVHGGRAVDVAGGHGCRLAPRPAAAASPLRVRNRSLWLVKGGRRTVLYRSPSEEVGPPVSPRFSPDERWVVFATDPYGSGSIAADGLPLWAVSVSGGRPILVERAVLGWPEFVRPCGARLVVSAGSDRYVSAGKRIDLVGPPGWKPVDLSRDARRSWFDGACSPDATWVAATTTINRDEGRFDTAERSIWLLATDGSSRRRLVGQAADGLSDEFPEWSRDGRHVLYVEHPTRANAPAGVYLVDLRTGARRGPLATFTSGLGYYGHHSWPFAWVQP
jgi:Tol biopolymer transport system component